MRNTAGNALVIDWKTGRKGEDADRTQVVCYALFAREKWRVDPHRAIGELHYLLTGEVEVVTLDETALERGRATMRRSIGGMRDRLEDPEANEAVMDRFEQTDDRFVCSHCNFRRVCWPEWPSLRMT
jgi:CRISPR/Cas system-associated exonuclease Cas4 (RecB family)